MSMTVKQYFNAFSTLLIKEVLRFARIWVQTILPPMITTALYFVIFGHLIGPRIGQIDGIDYINYLVPGLILMSVITQSYANVVSSFFSAKFGKNIEELLVSPMPHWLIIFGYVAGGVARGIAVGTAVTIVALFFADLQVHSIMMLFIVVILTAAMFSLAGLVNGVFARHFDHITIVPTFVLTPLTYLGGVFYSIHMLSEFWQTVSLFNPVLYIVNSFRYAMLGVSDVSIWICFIILITGIAALYSYALWLFKHGVGLRG